MSVPSNSNNNQDPRDVGSSTVHSEPTFGEITITPTTTIRTSDGAEIPTAAAVPDVAFNAVAAREALVCDVLKRNHYTRGNYYLQSGFSVPVFLACSGQLQEVHVTIDAKRASRRMQIELARALYPFPVVLHTRAGEETLPIVPPVGCRIGVREFWEMAKERGVYEGVLGEDGRPKGAPEIEYWGEGDVEAMEGKGWRCVCC